MTKLAGTVLALRALGLGDALTGIPALRGLRRAFPDHRLVLAAPQALGAWLAGLAVVDAVLATPDLQPLNWSGAPPEVAVDLHGCGPRSHRPLQDLLPQRLYAFDCAEADVSLDWNPDEHEVQRWCRLVRSAGGECGPEDLRLDLPQRPSGDDVVVLHPGAASGSRRWCPERWAAVARTLGEDGHHVVVTGSASERKLCEQVTQAVLGADNTAGRLSLDTLTSLVAGARLVLCGDTGVAHLATACATPSVLLFGPTPPHRWGPAIDHAVHIVLWPGDPEEGAWGDPHGLVIDPLLAAITVEEVLSAARRLLSGCN